MKKKKGKSNNEKPETPFFTDNTAPLPPMPEPLQHNADNVQDETKNFQTLSDYELRLIEKERLKTNKIKDKLLRQHEKQMLKETIKKEKLERKALFNVIRHRKWNDWRGWLNQIKDAYFPGETMLICMELRNGMHTQFMIMLKGTSFKYKEGEYVIDQTLKYYNIAAKMWCLDYHQDIPVPVKRLVPVQDIKNSIELEGITDIDTALNPQTLRQFIIGEFVQKIMKGEEMDKVFKMLKTLGIVTVFLQIATFLIIFQSSGGLSGLMGK